MAQFVTLEDLVVRDGELHIRHISADIATIFEDILADNDILVPDDEREGDEGEAALYGDTYSEFEDGITEQLAYLIDGVRANGADTMVVKNAVYESFTSLLARHSIVCPHDKDAVFAKMDICIAEALNIAAAHPKYPVNDWAY